MFIVAHDVSAECEFAEALMALISLSALNSLNAPNALNALSAPNALNSLSALNAFREIRPSSRALRRDEKAEIRKARDVFISLGEFWAGFPLALFRDSRKFAWSNTMNDQRPLHIPETQPASAGGPPRPPKKTARDLEDDSPQQPHVDIPDPVVVRDLASALKKKPFKIVADIMRFGVFVYAEDTVEFETASRVAWKHGFYARRVE